ncbi:MAG: 3-phosphoshikimate 1-carboxyvinyltransferase [Spirochaetales bacterium]|nr:3-phosphoshikimate 1-carboxyvinyltransferase [Spirochaetales bacterium]
MTLSFCAPSGIGGRITPPADKSVTHRALLLAAVASGPCLVRNPLSTGDCLSTRGCIEALGVAVTDESRSRGPRGTALRIEGRGLRGLQEPAAVLDAGNSGTTARLLAGLLAGQELFAVLSGDASLRGRPMLRVVEPLRLMGADIRGRRGQRFLPMCFLPGSGSLTALRHELPVASAQVKSALLLAGLRGDGDTVLYGRVDSRDHTERLLSALGVRVRGDQERLTVRPPERLESFDLTVPGDLSSAAFFLAAALISGRELEVRGCGLNPTRLGFVEVLRRMGARIEQTVEGEPGGEPVGTLDLTPGTLAATTVQAHEVPFLIDEIPLVAVLGAFAAGTTVVEGAGELRHKESDRLAAVAELLAAVGGHLELRGDGFAVEGPQRLRAGRVDAQGDHRLAMAGAVLGAGVSGGVCVEGFEAARVSYPDFVADYRALGGRAE